MTKLKISTRDKNLRQVLKIIEDYDLPYKLKGSTLIVDANKPENNERVADIMEAAENYSLG